MRPDAPAHVRGHGSGKVSHCSEAVQRTELRLLDGGQGARSQALTPVDGSARERLGRSRCHVPPTVWTRTGQRDTGLHTQGWAEPHPRLACPVPHLPHLQLESPLCAPKMRKLPAVSSRTVAPTGWSRPRYHRRTCTVASGRGAPVAESRTSTASDPMTGVRRKGSRQAPSAHAARRRTKTGMRCILRLRLRGASLRRRTRHPVLQSSNAPARLRSGERDLCRRRGPTRRSVSCNDSLAGSAPRLEQRA